jgi:hypothetical protein
MAEMFHGVTVDGSSSYVSEDEDGVDSDGDGDRDGDVFENNPMSLNSHKRGSSTTDTASSPNKKSKSPMVMLTKELIQEFKHERDESKMLKGLNRET